MIVMVMMIVMTMTIVIAMVVVTAILIVMIMKIEGSRNVVQKYNIYFMKQNHCRQEFQNRISCAGRLLLPKPESIRKASSTSRPTGSRPTSPTIPPGTTDRNSCRLSTPRSPRSSLPTRTPSRWQRRRTTRSWTWCRTPPSPTPTTPQPGSTTPGWLVAAKRLQLSFGFPQVNFFV